MVCYWTLHYFMQRKGNCVFWIPNMSVQKIHKFGLEGLWPNASVFRWHRSESLKACRCCIGCFLLYIYSSGEKHVLFDQILGISAAVEKLSQYSKWISSFPSTDCLLEKSTKTANALEKLLYVQIIISSVADEIVTLFWNCIILCE